MRKKILFIIVSILIVMGSFFVYKKYNEIPNEYLKFNEYGITYNLNENIDDYENKYFYNQLDETEKIYYQCFYNTSKDYELMFEFNFGFDEEKFNRAWTAFQSDFAEFYWWCNWQEEERVYTNDFGREFDYSFVVATGYIKADVVDAYPIIKEKTEKIIEEIRTNDDYETIKNLHDYIVLNTKYDLNSASNQNIRSVFLFNESVCAGYAQTFQYVCNEMGYECYSIEGTTYPFDFSTLHEWNLIKLNENWYWIDTTWDEVYDENGNEIGVSEDYLFVDDQILFIDHIPHNDFKLPSCDDKSLYFKTDAGMFVEKFDKNEIELRMKKWIKNGYHTFKFKLLNSNDSKEFDAYFNNGDFFEFYKNEIREYYDLSISWGYDDIYHFQSFEWHDYA